MTYNLARAVGPRPRRCRCRVGIPVAFRSTPPRTSSSSGLLVVRPRPQRRSGTRACARACARAPHPRLALLLFVILAVGFASDPVNTEAPAFATPSATRTRRGYHRRVRRGAVAAAFLTAGRVGSRRRMLVTLALLGTGIAAFSLSPGCRSASLPRRRRLRLPRLQHVGDAQLQLEVAEPQRGRIMALWSVASSASGRSRASPTARSRARSASAWRASSSHSPRWSPPC